MTSSAAGTAAWEPCGNGCTRRLRHLPDCPDPCVCTEPACDHCQGCEPRAADPGHRVCAACIRRAINALDDLPTLYEQLLDPSRPGGRAPGPRGNERPLPIRVGADTDHPGPTEHRQAIARELARLVVTLHRDHGITPPRVALHGALLAAVDDRLTAKFRALDADASAPKVNTRPPVDGPDPDKAARDARQVAEQNAAALLRKVIQADQRITRLTNTLDRTDPVHQHARHVAVHLHRLTARDDAPTTTTTLADLARTARRLAAPARPDGTNLGPCPTCATPVRALPQQTDDAVTCPGCGTTGPLDWWADTITGTTTGRSEATTRALAAWLSRRYGEPITETTIRKWGSRHPHLKTGRTDDRGRTLYDVTAVFAYADDLNTRQETA